MKLIAITGSIGCGKTTIANILKELGIVVFDVDGWVRRIYYNKEFIQDLSKVFPNVVDNHSVDKRKLRNIVFKDKKQLKKLEELIHPSLKHYLKRLINKYAHLDELFFLDVALLYEMGWDRYCDIVIVADVDYEIQKQRVITRDNVSEEHFDSINNVQMSNFEKKEKADIVIDTNKPINLLKCELIDIIEMIRG